MILYFPFRSFIPLISIIIPAITLNPSRSAGPIIEFSIEYLSRKPIPTTINKIATLSSQVDAIAYSKESFLFLNSSPTINQFQIFDKMPATLPSGFVSDSTSLFFVKTGVVKTGGRLTFACASLGTDSETGLGIDLDCSDFATVFLTTAATCFSGTVFFSRVFSSLYFFE